MRKPTQLETFDVLYGIIAKQGGNALLGDDVDVVRKAYAKTLYGDACPNIIMEFPLIGTPGLDILAIYGEIEKSQFRDGAGYGYDDMFHWFSSLPTHHPCSMGLELDVSKGNIQQAGVYLQQRSKYEYIHPFLESCGEAHRMDGLRQVIGRMPKDMPVSYIGLFPGREGTPMRIGGYMNDSLHKRVVETPKALQETFDQLGFNAYDNDMIERCSQYMGYVDGIDFQFDIMPDGSLGDVFGLSLSFNEYPPRLTKECMEQGSGSLLMKRLMDDGLADERWKHIPGMVFGKGVPYEKDDGTFGVFVVVSKMNYAKIKFKNGVAQPAKFYLSLMGKNMS